MAPAKSCVICGREFVKQPTCSRARWEKRQTCSRDCGNALKRGRANPRLGDAHRGKKLSPEHRAKLAEAMLRRHAEGRAHVIDTAGHAREQSSQWKGEDIGYRAAHVRIYVERGRPEECDLCGTRVGPFEWALRDDAPVVKAELVGRFAGKSYSVDTGDYMPACRPCHRDYDGRERDAVTGRYL